jgi:integrase
MHLIVVSRVGVASPGLAGGNTLATIVVKDRSFEVIIRRPVLLEMNRAASTSIRLSAVVRFQIPLSRSLKCPLANKSASFLAEPSKVCYYGGRKRRFRCKEGTLGSVEPYQTAKGKRYRVQYRTPDRRNTMKRGFATKREAEQYLASVEVSKMRGEWIDLTKSRIAVAELAEEWFGSQLQIKPTTRSGYRFALDKYVLPKWGLTPIAEVTHGAVQAWVNQLAEKLGPSMVRQIHLVLFGVFKFAIRDGRLVKNPSADIRLPRLQKKKRGYLTHAQVRALVKECGDWGVIVELLAYTGLRWGEMAALKRERLDFVRRRLEIAEAVSEPRGNILWGSPKNHERRSVPFPERREPALRDRANSAADDVPIFSGADGGVLRSGNFRGRTFNAAVVRCIANDPTFPKVTVHDLRHTAASLAISAGANVKAVQRMLGHASAAMTLDVYADLFDDDLDAVATVLNEQVAKHL